MKKQTAIEIVLTEYEARLIKKCLDYCMHRILTAPQAGIHKAIQGKQSEIKSLVQQFKSL